MVGSTGFVVIQHVALPALRALARLVRGPPNASAARPSARPAPNAPEQAVELPKGDDRWQLFPGPPPSCPPDFKPVASGTLPCTVQDFYQHVLSGQSHFYPDVHARVGKQWDIVVRRYKSVTADSFVPEADDKSLLGDTTSVFDFLTGGQVPAAGFTRTITFVNPKKPPSSVDALCVQRQQVAAYQGSTVVFGTAMNMLNIPFKDAFTVCAFWVVTPTPDGTCSVVISLKVKFLKRVLVGSIINATTFRDTALFYRGALDAAKTFFEQPAASRQGPPSAASRQLAQATALPVHGDDTRTDVAVRKLGDGGTSDMWKGLPLTSKQTKTLLIFLILATILYMLVSMRTELHKHMRLDAKA